ncbi:MAG: hypothetical protein E7576_10705 [Ruminococcaceae bacterium]|jgi:hypothetical protein|nr:hypothetical protein [Oscillospiraceae bacterium]
MKTTGDLFEKSFGEAVFGKTVPARYVYPREEMTREPIFPYFVLDGGAFHFACDVLGSAVSDSWLSGIMDGSLMDVFRQGKAEYGWEASFAYTDPVGFRKKYEWQIWPQRLYMTIPLAHAWLKTGEPKYAERWMEIVKGWDAAHPYQPFDPSLNYILTDMTWRDMQVAWRTLSLLHGAFMLDDAPFSADDWRYLCGFIRLHADHLLEESKDRLERRHAQNHVLQIGAALIMAGVLFPEFERSEEYIRYGRETVRMNMERAIFADGGSDEDSPSYSHFIARLYLEALLLLEKNGREPIPGLRESVLRQYEWLRVTMAPDGEAPRISDSYAMDARADLLRVSRLIPIRTDAEQGDVFLPDSKVAVIRRGRLTVLVDGMDYRRGHQHAGRPQILLWYGKDPVLTDGGCSSYDRWEFYGPLMTAAYHNVIRIPGEHDSRENDIRTFLDASRIGDGILMFGADVTTVAGASFRWERTLTVSEPRTGGISVTLCDRAEQRSAGDPLPFESNLYFGRHDADCPLTGNPDRRRMRLLSPDFLMTMESRREGFTCLAPVENGMNRIDYAIVFSVTESGGYENKTVLTFTDR